MKKKAAVWVDGEGSLSYRSPTGGEFYIFQIESGKLIGNSEIDWINFYGFSKLRGDGTTYKIIGDEE